MWELRKKFGATQLPQEQAHPSSPRHLYEFLTSINPKPGFTATWSGGEKSGEGGRGTQGLQTLKKKTEIDVACRRERPHITWPESLSVAVWPSANDLAPCRSSHRLTGRGRQPRDDVVLRRATLKRARIDTKSKRTMRSGDKERGRSVVVCIKTAHRSVIKVLQT